MLLTDVDVLLRLLIPLSTSAYSTPLQSRHQTKTTHHLASQPWGSCIA